MKKELFIEKFEEALIIGIDASDWQTGASRLDVIPIQTSIEEALRYVSANTEINQEHINDCAANIKFLPISHTLCGPGVSKQAIDIAHRVLSTMRAKLYTLEDALKGHSMSSVQEVKERVADRQARELREAIVALSEQEAMRMHIQSSAPPSYEQVRTEQIKADTAYARQVQESLNRGEEYVKAIIVNPKPQAEAESAPPPYSASLPPSI